VGVGVGSGFFCWDRSEFLRERERASTGGGDLNRGDTGK